MAREAHAKQARAEKRVPCRRLAFPDIIKVAHGGAFWAQSSAGQMKDFGQGKHFSLVCGWIDKANPLYLYISISPYIYISIYYTVVF